MNNVNELKIYLLDINFKMCEAWRRYFPCEFYENIEIICDDFAKFMKSHREINGIVSPGNSFGRMNGGYDFAILKYFGTDLQKEVQKYINKNLFSEQPVGTSFILNIPNANGIKLIHTPTMRTPSKIINYELIYHCMRSTLITALNNNISCIVIPAFGGATGGVPFNKINEMMWSAYRQILTH